MGTRNQKTEKERLAQRLRILGKALTDFREKAGLSKRALAKKLDVSPNFIWRVEQGDELKRWLSVEQLNGLAEGLEEYADEFRQVAGIVPLESQAILAKSQGFASTLERIHERFVEMLKAKGLSDDQIDIVLEQATEETIFDVVDGKEPLDIGYGSNAAKLEKKHRGKGHQVLNIGTGREEEDVLKIMERPSAYLSKNKDAFMQSPSQPRQRMHRATASAAMRVPEFINAGDAKIVLKRQITREERLALEAIAKVIAELLTR